MPPAVRRFALAFSGVVAAVSRQSGGIVRMRGLLWVLYCAGAERTVCVVSGEW